MADYPPFMNSTGLVTKVLEKIIEARRPERFTQDFLGAVLGFTSGSARAAIPLLKRINFLHQDGTPSDFYSKFKTESGRPIAMAAAMKTGYSEVFRRNEYADKLDKSKFRDLIVEMTGLERDSSTVQAIVGTFSALKAFADFDALRAGEDMPQDSFVHSSVEKAEHMEVAMQMAPTIHKTASGIGLNLAYTINLNLPETTNVEVFNAIFRSLKENMLK